MHYRITLFVINLLSENMLDPFGLYRHPSDADLAGAELARLAQLSLEKSGGARAQHFPSFGEPHRQRAVGRRRTRRSRLCAIRRRCLPRSAGGATFPHVRPASISLMRNAGAIRHRQKLLAQDTN